MKKEVQQYLWMLEIISITGKNEDIYELAQTRSPSELLEESKDYFKKDKPIYDELMSKLYLKYDIEYNDKFDIIDPMFYRAIHTSKKSVNRHFYALLKQHNANTCSSDLLYNYNTQAFYTFKGDVIETLYHPKRYLIGRTFPTAYEKNYKKVYENTPKWFLQLMFDSVDVPDATVDGVRKFAKDGFTTFNCDSVKEQVTSNTVSKTTYYSEDTEFILLDTLGDRQQATLRLFNTKNKLWNESWEQESVIIKIEKNGLNPEWMPTEECEIGTSPRYREWFDRAIKWEDSKYYQPKPLVEGQEWKAFKDFEFAYVDIKKDEVITIINGGEGFRTSSRGNTSLTCQGYTANHLEKYAKLQDVLVAVDNPEANYSTFLGGISNSSYECGSMWNWNSKELSSLNKSIIIGYKLKENKFEQLDTLVSLFGDEWSNKVYKAWTDTTKQFILDLLPIDVDELTLTAILYNIRNGTSNECTLHTTEIPYGQLVGDTHVFIPQSTINIFPKTFNSSVVVTLESFKNKLEYLDINTTEKEIKVSYGVEVLLEAVTNKSEVKWFEELCDEKGVRIESIDLAYTRGLCSGTITFNDDASDVIEQWIKHFKLTITYDFTDLEQDETFEVYFVNGEEVDEYYSGLYSNVRSFTFDSNSAYVKHLKYLSVDDIKILHKLISSISKKDFIVEVHKLVFKLPHSSEGWIPRILGNESTPELTEGVNSYTDLELLIKESIVRRPVTNWDTSIPSAIRWYKEEDVKSPPKIERYSLRRCMEDIAYPEPKKLRPTAGSKWEVHTKSAFIGIKVDVGDYIIFSAHTFSIIRKISTVSGVWGSNPSRDYLAEIQAIASFTEDFSDAIIPLHLQTTVKEATYSCAEVTSPSTELTLMYAPKQEDTLEDKILSFQERRNRRRGR